MSSALAFEARPGGSLLRFSLRGGVLLVPVVLLGLAASNAQGLSRAMLQVGTGMELLLAGLLLRPAVRQVPLSMPVIALYLIGLFWLWSAVADSAAWFPHLAQAILLIVPLLLLSRQSLLGSGLADLRHARTLASRLARRTAWPADPADLARLPEVRSLRRAVQFDAGPALPYLQHPSPAVRLAILTALAHHPVWRPGQAEWVLQVVQRSTEPAVRAAGVAALANVPERELVEGLTRFLFDPAPAVRQVAGEVLLGDAARRWPWVRGAMHAALADPRLCDDGPLVCPAALSALAIADLTGWAGETGVLCVRATTTLVAHYRRALQESGDPSLAAGLRHVVGNRRAPAILRVELAHLLHEHAQLDATLLEAMLAPDQPSSLRLLSADALLRNGTHSGALAALREIARQPNREMALSAAVIVQNCLGVDLGLAYNQPPPPLHTQQAAEVTRRVQLWATQVTPESAGSGLRTSGLPARSKSLRPRGDHRSTPNSKDSGTGSGLCRL